MNRKFRQDVSYSHSAKNSLGKVFIKVLENATGRLALLKRVQSLGVNFSTKKKFWQSIMNGYGVKIVVLRGNLQNIPTDGPIIVVANHPYGILDGLVMGSVLAESGTNFKILANDIFQKVQYIRDVILPVSFQNNREGVSLNLKTRKNALDHLRGGGAIGIFPGGTVSTGSRLLSQPVDPEWRSFTAKMILKSNALVIPIFFDGHTSRLFQFASRLHPILRAGLLVREFKLRTDTSVKIVIGRPISRDRMEVFKGNSKEMMDFLRRETYKLSPNKNQSFEYGYDFELKN
jgi:1-acyl-sn-glycerol-3-phosphate acyltransferase